MLLSILDVLLKTLSLPLFATAFIATLFVVLCDTPIHPNSLYPFGVFGLFNSTKLYPSTISTVTVDDSIIMISLKLLFNEPKLK